MDNKHNSVDEEDTFKLGKLSFIKDSDQILLLMK